MNRLARLGVVALFTLALTITLFGSLSSTSAMPAMKDPPPLHYKSRAGLMPPAYVPSAHAPLRTYNAATFRFLSPYVTTTVGSWPQVLALADLTGDARSDAALATDRYSDPANDEMLHLFAGQAGDLVSRTQRLPAGSGPESIVAGDFDQDGRQDVALALTGEDAVLVYTQTPSHTLTSTLSLDRPGAPNAVAAGDFTGDLRDDLAAIAPLSGTLAVWRDWTSHGGWTSQPPTILPYPTGGYDALDVGDLDNDGDDDLVALRGAGYLTESVVIYWQDAGHFPISTTLTPETGGYLPHSLAVGDVTGDGLDDIAVTAGGNAPDAFLNVFALGVSGPATTPITYAAHHLPSAVVIGDVDHDGLNDVVVTHDAWQMLSVFTQTVSGTLSAYATAPIPYSDRYRSDALALADLDGNGGLDAALVDRDHGLVILTNTLSAPDAAVVSPTHTSLHLPGPLTISGTASTDAVTVEVRLKGHTDWTTATLNGATWGLSLTLPSEERAWWIEARAIDAQGRVQSPPDRVRIGLLDDDLAFSNNLSYTPILREALPGEIWIMQPTVGVLPLVTDTKSTHHELSLTSDTTPPSTPTNLVAQTSGLFAISAKWDNSVDPESGIDYYAYAIGTGTTITDEANIKWWQSTGTRTEMHASLVLTENQVYYISVRASNGANLQSDKVRSRPLTATHEVYGQITNEIHFDISPIGYDASGNVTATWTLTQSMEISHFLSLMFPVLYDLYGPPSTNYTVTLVRDLRYTSSAIFFPANDEIHLGDTATYQLITHELVHAWRNDRLLASDDKWQYNPTLSGFEEGFAQAVSYDAMTEFAQRYPDFGLSQKIYQSSCEWDYDFQNVPELRTTVSSDN